MIGLEKSFCMIYSNTHLRTRETLPLMKDWLTLMPCEMFGQGQLEEVEGHVHMIRPSQPTEWHTIFSQASKLTSMAYFSVILYIKENLKIRIAAFQNKH